MSKKYLIITISCLIFSIIAGLITKDLLIGGTSLFTGLLCAYFASEGKRINYMMGLINYLLMGYVALKNNIYGIFIFYILIFAPLQIKGFLTWKDNVDEEENLIIRKFNLKNSITIITTCIIVSIILGYLLSLIPNEKLSFMDATSNCINLCGVILMILRFSESWYLWLLNNIIDLIIWIIIVINKGNNSIMMLLVSTSYLLINIYGIVKWNRKKVIDNNKS